MKANGVSQLKSSVASVSRKGKRQDEGISQCKCLQFCRLVPALEGTRMNSNGNSKKLCP